MDNPGLLEITGNPKTSKTKWQPGIALRGCLHSHHPISRLKSDSLPTRRAVQSREVSLKEKQRCQTTLKMEGERLWLHSEQRRDELGRARGSCGVCMAGCQNGVAKYPKSRHCVQKPDWGACSHWAAAIYEVIDLRASSFRINQDIKFKDLKPMCAIFCGHGKLHEEGYLNFDCILSVFPL